MSANHLHSTAPTMEPNKGVPPEKPSVWDRYDCAYTPVRPEGDIWANCLKPLREEDEKQCKAWRDEVQNLLIFAGLFSAVVTPFVVDSYKNLQPSTDQRTVDLLSQILIRLDNSSTNFLVSSSSSLFSPSPSSIRVNALWFTSLVLSLTTVLVGIVSLQWLTEYEYYSGHWTPKEIFEIRNMRYESVNEWFVHQVFTGLPLLLQAALVLFFIGLMDFLLHLYPRTAIPTVIVIFATLSFLALTTFLPTLQFYTTYKSQSLDKPPTPFPYKSRQSWAILRTAESVRKFFKICSQSVKQLTNRSLDNPRSTIPEVPVISDWNKFDWGWVCKRTSQAAGIRSDPQPHHYDTAHGVANIITKYSGHLDKSLALSAYHCFLEQHDSHSNAVYQWSPQRQSHFYKCIGESSFRGTMIPFDYQDSPHLPGSSRQDMALLAFLHNLRNHLSPIPGIHAMIRRKEMELFIRMSKFYGHSDLLDTPLALASQSLYGNLVEAFTNETDESDLWQPVAAGVGEVTAMIHLCRPSHLHRDMGNYHARLAQRILKSGTDHNEKSSELAHKLGYAFVERIFHGQNERGSLPKWRKDYKESFVFLVYAIHKTMDKFPGTAHNPVIITRIRDFLSKISPDSHACVPTRYRGPLQTEPEPKRTSQTPPRRHSYR